MANTLKKFFSEDPLTPHPQSPFTFKGLLAGIAIVFVTFIAALIGFLSNKPLPADQPLKERQVTETGCTGRTGNSLQSCCESELTANSGMKASCVGKWEINNNQCNWVCSSTP
jgi:hypothetical protein